MNSDMMLTSKVIQKCVEKCENYGYDTISISEVAIEKGFWASCIAFEKLLYTGDDSIITPRF